MLRVLTSSLLLLAALPAQDAARVHLANGIKIGEATTTSALVWARVTRDPEANVDGLEFEGAKPAEPQLPADIALEEMQGAVPGARGDLRVRYWVEGRDDEATTTPWQLVAGLTDFTHTFRLDGLSAGTRYRLTVEARPTGTNGPATSVQGGFRTAPMPDAEVGATFCVIACQDYPRRDNSALGHAIYEHMRALEPDFFVHTGDTIYYDKPLPFATNEALARFKWNRFYGLLRPRQFHAEVSSWFIKDDHDTLKNDCWPGQSYRDLTWETGLRLFREQNPIGAKSYRRIRWGKHLECWFLEGREYRSPNRMKDGPEKTILGEEQMQWLQRTLRESTATFRVVVSATPIVGPDRKNKTDNHANLGFQHEGNRLRELLANTPNTIVVCGDRHWQYASHDLKTGLREWSCGAASDKHAGGFRMRDRSESHDFLRIAGGFLQVSVELSDTPQLVLRHRGTDGSITNEDILPAR